MPSTQTSAASLSPSFGELVDILPPSLWGWLSLPLDHEAPCHAEINSVIPWFYPEFLSLYDIFRQDSSGVPVSGNQETRAVPGVACRCMVVVFVLFRFTAAGRLQMVIIVSCGSGYLSYAGAYTANTTIRAAPVEYPLDCPGARRLSPAPVCCVCHLMFSCRWSL